MNTRHALIVVITSASFLIACASDQAAQDERHVERLMRHRDWPRIQQVAETEVNKREIFWPRIQQVAETEVNKREILWAETAAYVPMDHEDQAWSVTAMSGDRDLKRVVDLVIADDGTVLVYERNWDQDR